MPISILMDEPFVSLDQPTRERMQREVLHIWEHRRRTVIFVTHNLEEAVFLGDRVIILSAKPARIVADIAVPTAAAARSAGARVHTAACEMRGRAARAAHEPRRAAPAHRWLSRSTSWEHEINC